MYNFQKSHLKEQTLIPQLKNKQIDQWLVPGRMIGETMANWNGVGQCFGTMMRFRVYPVESCLVKKTHPSINLNNK
ncbi:hypothetical protein Hanom_Chr16g01490701 [Helianthus anomalus]